MFALQNTPWPPPEFGARKPPTSVFRHRIPPDFNKKPLFLATAIRLRRFALLKTLGHGCRPGERGWPPQAVRSLGGRLGRLPKC